MALFLYGCALVLILLAAAAFIVYLVRQNKSVTTGPTDCSWRGLLLSPFLSATNTTRSAWHGLDPQILALLFCLDRSAGLCPLSFEVPAHGARIFCGACCSVPSHPVLDPFGRRCDGQTRFQESLAPGAHRDSLCGERIFCGHFRGGDHVPDPGVPDQEEALGFTLQQAPILETLDSINHVALICGFTS